MAGNLLEPDSVGKMKNQNTDIFVALNTRDNIILGTLISIGGDELVFQSISEDSISMGSFQSLDVFSTGQIFYRELPVQIMADDRFIDGRSWIKMITRKIRVRFHDEEASAIIADRMNNMRVDV